MRRLSLYHEVYAPTGVSDEQANDLVLLHGWGMHSIVWDDVMPSLLKQHRVTVIDLPGMGQSPMPGGDYNFDYLIEHVLKVAPPKAIWIGWSLGGLIAAAMAARFPERVEHLVTVASSPCFVFRDDWSCALPQKTMNDFITLFEEDSEGTLIQFLALQCKGSVTMEDDIKIMKDILYHGGLPATKALRCGLRIFQSIDLRNELASVRCPTLHVFGANDHIIPAAIAEEVEQLYPGAATVVLENIAHVPHISNPGLFIQTLEKFWQSMGRLKAIA